ncbi:MAG: hypothetical protein CBD61_00610 [Pelagibacteraceae bacterium TMED201]|nr:DUF1989 domain-containing protein [Pelagibacterales bacterium SAG-MED30]OUW64072.1 MAG: hypothetical protein CBD61_00610 [Pelagibacteraceae bacterium TMED201]|tara:strand:+ start:135 stop:1001 length:867 start_codon:yes stop_codon:yes gene_type:complete
MKIKKFSKKPKNLNERLGAKPIICYPNENLENENLKLLHNARKYIEKINEVIIPPRDAKTFNVKSGNFFRIESIEGPQVGDLNLFQANNLDEKFYSGKTRALYGTHISVGDKMLSSFPYLRSLATITWDTLDWYGYDKDGASVHDVIGTRCDPYTSKLLSGDDYHYCCHSNLSRALAKEKKININDAEKIVHDVLNVFMLTGFTNDTKQYFMKSSPARPGDYLEFFAETDLLGVLSTCPGGDCGSEHSSDVAKCYPLKVTIWNVDKEYLNGVRLSNISSYNRNHGLAK